MYQLGEKYLPENIVERLFKNPYYVQDEYYKLVKPILEHEEFLKRKNYPHHYQESVYDHVLRVSYDCYKIGKKVKSKSLLSSSYSFLAVNQSKSFSYHL